MCGVGQNSKATEGRDKKTVFMGEWGKKIPHSFNGRFIPAELVEA